jgi:hypothetical protein
MDAGVLLALMGRLEAQEPYVDGELADAQCFCSAIRRSRSVLSTSVVV